MITQQMPMGRVRRGGLVGCDGCRLHDAMVGLAVLQCSFVSRGLFGTCVLGIFSLFDHFCPQPEACHFVKNRWLPISHAMCWD